MIKIKHIYQLPHKKDGFRILVDRLWPRGLSKEKASVDLWLKDIAPTTELRQWFNHDPKKWTDFSQKYQQEIEENSENLTHMQELCKKYKTLTLLYAAKDETHNHALVLKHFLGLN